MTTRRLLIGLTLACLLATGATGVAAETIKIGDINSYTRMAQHTEHAKRGMEMALAEINEAGGIGGKMLELISRDDAGEPGEAIRVAEELVTREGVQIITGTTLSNVGLAVASFAEQNRVLYLATEPLADAMTVVNTTSLGMTGQAPWSIPLDTLNPDAVVTDLVYAPLETPLLSTAKAIGCTCVDGLGMLLHQGVPGFERWFGVRPEVDSATRAAVLR